MLSKTARGKVYYFFGKLCQRNNEWCQCYPLYLSNSLLSKYLERMLCVSLENLAFQRVFTLRGCLLEISFRGKWNIFNSVSGQSHLTLDMKYLEMKLMGVISLQLFWQKLNNISGDKTLCKRCPKMKWFERKHLRMLI